MWNATPRGTLNKRYSIVLEQRGSKWLEFLYTEIDCVIAYWGIAKGLAFCLLRNV